jgi:hypothetical protein
MPQATSNQKLVPLGIVVLLLALGAGLRIFDLTDQPIDFHPTRQLRGAIIARGMYYQMQPGADPQTRQDALAFWASTGQYEPSILERAAAVTYLLAGSEIPWLARLYNSILWLIGGIALFDLARRMSISPAGNHADRNVLFEHRAQPKDAVPASQAPGLRLRSEERGQRSPVRPPLSLPVGEAAAHLRSNDPGRDSAAWIGALAALAYYMVLPFSVQASRSFQPDPGMAVWIVMAAYSAFRWSERPGWKWALLAGAFSGLAVLTKAVSFYTIAGILGGLTIYTYWSDQDRSMRRALGRLVSSPQVWVMAALAIFPTLVYYLGRGGRASEYFSSWTLALLPLLLQPETYLRWLNLVQELLNPFALLLALAGVLLAKGRSRWLMAGMWLGYLAYGLFLPYQMTSHSYYHLQLVPIVGLSLAPVAYRLVRWLMAHGRVWQTLAGGAIMAALVYGSWQALIPLYSRDYRNEPAYWQEIASYLPEDGKIIALTQDYGYRLMYYGWRKVVLWPNRGEIKLNVLRGSEKEFREYFVKRIDGKSYFLITAFGQLEDQPALKETLYENFPIQAQGDGYLIFDLLHPTTTADG